VNESIPLSGVPAPTLSILVPTYNYAPFLDDALRSLGSCMAELEPGSAELVVVDDGSTDHTPEILARWADRPGIRAIRRDNGGVAAARNTAMEHARGELLMFFDSDDVLLPGCLRHTLDFFSSHSNVGMFFTNYDLFDESGVTNPSGVDTWSVFRSFAHREVGENEWIFEEDIAAAVLEYGSFMHTSGLTVRRNVAHEAGSFREGYTYGEDDDYWARCARLTRVGYRDELLSRKRNHAGSIIHDPARRVSNLRSILALTELQRREFEGEPYQRILRAKALRCARSFVWEALEAGEATEARKVLRRYLRHYPWKPELYRLAIKAALTRG
jgi:glycosyltransferase involved in cell wall biosynthesis